MGEAHRKKKQPEQVRRLLLDCTLKIIGDLGLGGVTLDAVAKAAGITKGGLFHHFANKQALIDAMFLDMLDQFDQQLNAHMAVDVEQYGRFTRAYVRTVFAEDDKYPPESIQSACISIMTDHILQKMWGDWLTSRLEMHKETDTDPVLQIVRLAADGAWLSLLGMAGANIIDDVNDLYTRLLAMTFKT